MLVYDYITIHLKHLPLPFKNIKHLKNLKTPLQNVKNLKKALIGGGPSGTPLSYKYGHDSGQT